jgi:hypothetical protein
MFLQRLPSGEICIADFRQDNEPIPDEGERWGNVKNGAAPREEPCRFSKAPAKE